VKQTLVMRSSGVSGIFEAPEPPEFYQFIGGLTHKEENDKIYMLDGGRRVLLDGYAPNRGGYAALNRIIYLARNRSWVPVSVAKK